MRGCEINCSIANTATNGGDMVSVKKHFKRNVLDVKIGTETDVQPRSSICVVSKVRHDKMLINI